MLVLESKSLSSKHSNGRITWCACVSVPGVVVDANHRKSGQPFYGDFLVLGHGVLLQIKGGE